MTTLLPTSTRRRIASVPHLAAFGIALAVLALALAPALPRMLTAPTTLRARTALAAQELPLGDGHVTDHPAAGNVYACRTRFRRGGARHDGPWFHGDTWDPTEKPHVSGHVMWPDAAFTLTSDAGELLFTGNGLPVREPTGRFPIARTDSVYRYDTNPNHVGAQHLRFEIPARPTRRAACPWA